MKTALHHAAVPYVAVKRTSHSFLSKMLTALAVVVAVACMPATVTAAESATVASLTAANAITRLQKQFQGAAVYNLELTSGNGSAINAATCNAIQRNTSTAPDGTEILVNGQFPGPTLRVKKDQLLVVRVVNKLVNSTIAVHWHGIVQAGTPYADGTSMVSQCPLAPGGDEFVYVMKATQAGTYIYHGHIRLSPVNLYGMVVVDEPSKNKFPNVNKHFTSDVSLLLSDAWNKTSVDQLAGLRNHTFAWIGNPQALLLNGRVRSPLSTTKSATSCAHPVIQVSSSGRSLVRIANAATLAFISLTVEGHEFLVLRADTEYVQPFRTKELQVNSGQRYDVMLVKQNATAANSTQTAFWIRAKMIHRANTPESWGVLSYDASGSTPALAFADPPADFSTVVPAPVEKFGGLEAQLQPFRPQNKKKLDSIPAADVEYVFQTRQAKASANDPMLWLLNGLARTAPMDYPLVWYVNQMQAQLAAGKTQAQVEQWLNATVPAPERRPMVFKQNQVVQFVIQDTVSLNGVCEQHPIHLHLGDLAVLKYGNGTYVPNSIPLAAIDNPVNITYRDTFTMFPSSNKYDQPTGTAGADCGWVAVRAKLSNPGASILHCHIASHMSMGMAIYMAVLPAKGQSLPKSSSLASPFKTSLVTNCTNYLALYQDPIDV